MARYKATRHGQIPFTSDEDAEADANELPTLASRLIELKIYRQQKEFGGFVFGGNVFGSDQEDQRKIDGAVLGAQLSPDVMINFKTESGYVQIDAATMISIGKALFDHVQACHTREMELIEELEDDINTDITIGWPGEAE